MQVVKVEIVNWKKTFLTAVLLAFVHPAVNLANNLFAGQSWSYALSKFWMLLAMWLIINLLFAAKRFFSSRIRLVNGDENGLQVWAGCRSRSVAWWQVASMERSLQTEDKTPRYNLALRDAGGGELIRLCREVEEPPQLKEQWEQLESLITSKIGKRGVVSAPIVPAPAKTSFVLHPKFKTLTMFSLFAWLPGFFLSWTDPRGGLIWAAMFGILAIAGFLVAAFEARYEVNEAGVSTKNLLQRKFLAWNDIRRASIPYGPHSIHLEGDEVDLELEGPADWGKDGANLMLFLQTQFTHYEIPWEGDKALSWRDFFVQPK